MNATTLVSTLRRHREGLASRWRTRFVDRRVAAHARVVRLRESLVLALVDEVIGLLGSDHPLDIPRRHGANAFAELAPFPENVAICIDAFQAGAEVFGEFVAESDAPSAGRGSRGLHAIPDRLDSVFRILVHREIEAVCEGRLERVRAFAGVGTEGLPSGRLSGHATDAVLNN